MTVLPPARSSAEAHRYLDLHPCGCGETRWQPQVDVVALADGELATRYHGDCPRCGTRREFRFRLPPQPSPPATTSFAYGGPEPSQLIDPGEWLLTSDQYAELVPADPARLTDTGQRRHATAALDRAIAALDEVLKFVPVGAREVPSTAFTSDTGRRMWRREAARFQIDRLRAVRDAYAALRASVVEDPGTGNG
ncbi:hypothetical protein ACN27F_17710 [Solwaraspora sp. WMMB335]|uniref:hypothetical protein n=1 Tax=Solwaraspora sp. WMMB335 TaxID=3404118 RepID=UPI003B95CC95